MSTLILPTGLRVSEFDPSQFATALDSASTNSLIPTADAVEDYSLRGYYRFGDRQITSGAAAYDFYGFPIGCSDIVLDLTTVSLTTNDSPLVQFIVNGSPVTTGYTGSGSSFGASTTATVFGNTGGYIRILSAGLDITGRIRITRLNGNLWQISHLLSYGTSIVGTLLGTSTITLAGNPNGIRLTTTGGLFDLGSARIGWR